MSGLVSTETHAQVWNNPQKPAYASVNPTSILGRDIRNKVIETVDYGVLTKHMIISCPPNGHSDHTEGNVCQLLASFTMSWQQLPWYKVSRSRLMGSSMQDVHVDLPLLELLLVDSGLDYVTPYTDKVIFLRRAAISFLGLYTLAGTIPAAGKSIPTDLSKTQIDVYASTDHGYSWKFVSHVAAGGKADPTNGQTPVWEPFFMAYNGQLVLYYSDQRDSAHNQKVVHQVTANLVTWGSVVDDVASSTYSDRPGMTTIAALPNGKYILTYEYAGAPANLAAYYRISDSPLTFQSATGYNIKAATGEQTKSSPFVVWTPYGGTNRTIMVSANSHSGLFLNTQLGAVGSPWTYLASSAIRGYARDLRVLPTSNQILMTCGGSLGGSSNAVRATVVNLP
ncbi:hypothetical protein DL96DRAFT_1810302 [Flagelloscypha sp. PMI_526]|nr:hypothetical protein DL96DRAFT_1810302 [Flagelloscypha sp. PMI_526]